MFVLTKMKGNIFHARMFSEISLNKSCVFIEINLRQWENSITANHLTWRIILYNSFIEFLQKYSWEKVVYHKGIVFWICFYAKPYSIISSLKILLLYLMTHFGHKKHMHRISSLGLDHSCFLALANILVVRAVTDKDKS